MTEAEAEQLRRENQELREKVASFEEKLEAALVWNEQLRKALFGRKSEKIRVLQTDDREISLFDEAEQEAKAGEPEPDACGTTVKAHTRKPKRKRDELLEGIPHQKKTIPLPEAERFCNRHPGTPLVKLGEKFVRTEVHYIPQKIEVIDIYQEAWQCPACKAECM